VPAGVPVEVVHARPEEQCVVVLSVPAGTTVREAIERSGLLARFPQIDLATHRVGVFGTACALDRPVEPGDRVEIYRPLLTDPKEARRRRATRRRV
jgi:uncharacterized protein